MTTVYRSMDKCLLVVVEAYRLGRYDNFDVVNYYLLNVEVVEAYRLGRYDNKGLLVNNATRRPYFSSLRCQELIEFVCWRSALVLIFARISLFFEILC